MTCVIKDEVTVQLYGDQTLIDQIAAVLRCHAMTVSQSTPKEYTTKRGKQGSYCKLKVNI